MLHNALIYTIQKQIAHRTKQEFIFNEFSHFEIQFHLFSFCRNQMMRVFQRLEFNNRKILIEFYLCVNDLFREGKYLRKIGHIP